MPSEVPPPHIVELSDPHIRALILDDEDCLELLRERLDLPTLKFEIKTTREQAYAAVLANPFSYDVVFVDYRLDGWDPISREVALTWGLPDSIVRGRLFEPAIAQNLEELSDTLLQDRAILGGHTELLIQLASRHNVLIVATSFHTGWGKDPVPRLRAMGAQHFLSKQGDELEIQQAEALVMTLGGERRDRRLWGALSQETTRSILTELEAAGAVTLRRRLADYSTRSPRERDEDCVSTESAERRRGYLINTLGWLREPRLNCAQELLEAASSASNAADHPRARELFLLAQLLQPTLPSVLEPTASGDGSIARPIESEVDDAYRRHDLSADAEYLHLVIGEGITRLDFYASQRLSGKQPTRCEYLGTNFSPRLAAAVDRSGVWPPRTLSKLRHLLRAPRECRVVHQAGAIVRCGAGVFGPTIDTYLLGDVLKSVCNRSTEESIRLSQIVELGLGTGHLSCVVLASVGRQVKQLYGSDVSASALALARHNIEAAIDAGKLQLVANIQQKPDFLENLPAGEIDLIISNPPYLPAPRDATTAEIADSATAGEQLIRHILVDQGPRVLKPSGAVLLVASTLTRSMINDARTVAHSRGIDWYPRKLRELPWVPLDLPEVQDDPSWLRLLLEQRAMHVYFDLAASEFPLRHGIEVRVFSRSPATAEAFVRAAKVRDPAM